MSILCLKVSINIINKYYHFIIIIFIATKACFSAIFDDFLRNKLNNENFSKNNLHLLKSLLTYWQGIFTRFVPNENEQLYFISVIEDLCIENPKLIDVFHIMIQYLNSEEFSVLSDDVILKWSELEKSEYPTSEGFKTIPEDYHRSFKDKMKRFLDKLSLY